MMRSSATGLLGPRVVLLALASALISGTGAVAAEPDQTFEMVPVDSLQLAITGVAVGLTWVGPDTLVVLDAVPDTLAEDGRRHLRMVFTDRAGEILLEQDFTGVLRTGLAYDGESLWSCGDGEDGRSLLYRISLDSLLVKDAFDLPGHHPIDMCFDGRYIWLTDQDSGHLDRFDPRTEAVTRSIYGPAFSPGGIAWDGRHTWLADMGTGRLYRLTGSRGDWSATVSAESFLYRGKRVLLLHDGFSLHLVRDGEHFAERVVF
ncbi:hypothetical protein CO151_01365 [bacterium CG_4_9_14_3_um_filter_65_15]|nr:MAG: hypothetical protein CO151_01365 [bacterium CG_4_9_14_3_um_filter_65_15]